MIKHGFFSLLAFCLGACVYEGLAPINTSPVREIWYKQGEKIGLKSFSYDGNGRLVREYYADEKNPLANEETVYEYDAQGLLTLKKIRQPEITKTFFVTEWTYQGGLKKIQTTYLDNNPLGYRDLFFYTGNLLDSSQLFAYSTIDQRYNFLATTRYHYDLEGRLAQASYGDRDRTIYRYDGKLLVATCNVFDGDDGSSYEDCVEQEYSRAGQLLRVSTRNLSGTRVKEELFYRAGRLDEKRVFFYPSYPNNQVDITVLRYEY